MPSGASRLSQLRRGGGFFFPGPRTRVRVTGADRLRYLNGQLSNDLRRLAPGEAIAALVLTAKGKLCADLSSGSTEMRSLLRLMPRSRKACPPVSSVTQSRTMWLSN